MKFAAAALLLSASCVLSAQTTILVCQASSNPPVVRAEGITERTGDIVLSCSGGQPNAAISGNLSVFLSVPITNRVTATNAVTNVQLTIDTGSGPVLSPVIPLFSANGIVFDNVQFHLSARGTADLRVIDVRGAASVLNEAPGSQITAFLAFNGNSLVSIENNNFTVGTPLPSLLVGYSGRLFCGPHGSPLPSTITFSNLLAAGTVFATTRVTEGFASAFAPKSDFSNYLADTGDRIIINYSGFVAGSSIYVPLVVAGSNALQPTAGGDLGLTASGGQYLPGSGTLLLALVNGADASGAGGTPGFLPSGTAAETFNTVVQIPLNNGAGYAVYEVVDADMSRLESAQIPTFLGLPPYNGVPVETNETVTLAPVSNVVAVSTNAPIPRFEPFPPGPDCGEIGDCSASYFPRLIVDRTPLTATAPSGGGYQVRYIPIRNQGGGVLQWIASVAYQNGSGYLTLSPSSGVNNGTARVDFHPENLPQGVYQATITIASNAESNATVTVPVTFTVTAPGPPQVTPIISAITNGASFLAGPVAPGSIATVLGSNLSGDVVSVTFDGAPAQLLYHSATQINLVVPASLVGKTSTQVIVSAGSATSAAYPLSLTPVAPAIFPGAVLNQDNTSNTASNPARTGTVLQIFATGLPSNGVLSVTLGGQTITSLYYGGPAPGIAGVEQIDLLIPANLNPGATTLSVCGAAAGSASVCSPAVPVTISQ